jgi:hypothetical protein
LDHESLDSRGYGGRRVPDWARFFEPDQLGDFLLIVRNGLREYEVESQVDVEAGIVQVSPLGYDTEGTRLLGLSNLAQLCRKIARNEWEEVIAGHLGQLLRLPEEGGDLLERLGEDFEEAREYLKLRLMADGLPNQDQLVLRKPMEGVLSVLVYDMPDAIATVPRQHVTNWCRFDDELFELAMNRVRADRPDREMVEIEDGVVAAVLAGESYFAASHALLINEYLPPDSDRGALVVLPHRHLVVYHEIKDERVVPALNRLVQLAHSMHADGPGAISPSVFWYQPSHRRYHRIHAEVGDDSIEIYPPAEFVEMLNGLVE